MVAKVKKSRLLRKRRTNPNTRKKVYERDGYCCLKCGSKENLTIDHVIPLKDGGKNTEENYQTLCFDCNMVKGEKIIDYRK